MQLTTQRSRQWLFVGFTGLAVVFTIDVMFPLGVNTAHFYELIAICAFFLTARDAIVLASVATTANVLGYSLAPAVDFPEWMVALTRGASVFATWLLIVTGVHFHKQSQTVIAALRQSNERRRLALESAEQARRERDRGLRLVTNAIPMLIGYVDRDERFQFNNAAFQEAYGVTPDHIVGRTLQEVAGEGAYSRLQPYVASALRGKRVQFEEQMVRADSVRWWLFQLLPRRDEQQQVVGLYVLVTDITGLKHSQEEVDRQREALALFSRRGAANEMAAALAHEMNQPLSTVAVYSGRLVELLRQGKADPHDLLDAMELMHEEAIRAGQIVKRARAMVDDKPLQPTLIGPSELLDSVKKICSTSAARAQTEIELEVAQGMEPVYADPIQLQQVLVNLVSNAIDASQGLPRARRRVVVAASSGEQGAEIAVIDSGHGMSAERLARIFEPHYSTKPEGLGIGLNIARSIVRTHGGELSATPNSVHGVTFRVVLPPAPAEPLFANDAENLPLLSKSV